jgi:hypothetical protein
MADTRDEALVEKEKALTAEIENLLPGGSSSSSLIIVKSAAGGPGLTRW